MNNTHSSHHSSHDLNLTSVLHFVHPDQSVASILQACWTVANQKCKMSPLSRLWIWISMWAVIQDKKDKREAWSQHCYHCSVCNMKYTQSIITHRDDWITHTHSACNVRCKIITVINLNLQNNPSEKYITSIYNKTNLSLVANKHLLLDCRSVEYYWWVVCERVGSSNH